jgi:hypothetical protein
MTRFERPGQILKALDQAQHVSDLISPKLVLKVQPVAVQI